MPSPSTIESEQEPVSAPEPAPAVKPKKQKPAGVEVHQRTVAAGGNLVPMPDDQQTVVPWK